MADDATVLARVQELTWALVDEEITDDEMTLLDGLLLSDESARRRYLDCMQLHASLWEHFRSPAEEVESKIAANSPVLGFLNTGTLPVGFDLPSADDLKS